MLYPTKMSLFFLAHGAAPLPCVVDMTVGMVYAVLKFFKYDVLEIIAFFAGLFTVQLYLFSFRIERALLLFSFWQRWVNFTLSLITNSCSQ